MTQPGVLNPAGAETRDAVLELLRVSRKRGYTVQVFFADGVFRTEDELGCFEVIRRDGELMWKAVIGPDGELTRVYPCGACGWAEACSEGCHS